MCENEAVLENRKVMELACSHLERQYIEMTSILYESVYSWKGGMTRWLHFRILRYDSRGISDSLRIY